MRQFQIDPDEEKSALKGIPSIYLGPGVWAVRPRFFTLLLWTCFPAFLIITLLSPIIPQCSFVIFIHRPPHTFALTIPLGNFFLSCYD